jgi:hypothetical protein
MTIAFESLGLQYSNGLVQILDELVKYHHNFELNGNFIVGIFEDFNNQKKEIFRRLLFCFDL